MYRRTVLGLASWWSGPLGNNNADHRPQGTWSGQPDALPCQVFSALWGANEISTATLANKTVANLRSSGLVEIAAPQPVT
ncbi:hypothetical protein PoMZ_08892 [Pyricularia oryzae]|uniref:Uncharacterized protein n=1 Tax=Pyricularia oryzae TaxID=318829 RepID=A0A4P7NIS3_PYROR|nr:hypothetical protein PoMZ_08892 [Pyricularia oryzae]